MPKATTVNQLYQDIEGIIKSAVELHREAFSYINEANKMSSLRKKNYTRALKLLKKADEKYGYTKSREQRSAVQIAINQSSTARLVTTGYTYEQVRDELLAHLELYKTEMEISPTNISPRGLIGRAVVNLITNVYKWKLDCISLSEEYEQANSMNLKKRTKTVWDIDQRISEGNKTGFFGYMQVRTRPKDIQSLSLYDCCLTIVKPYFDNEKQQYNGSLHLYEIKQHLGSVQEANSFARQYGGVFRVIGESNHVFTDYQEALNQFNYYMQIGGQMVTTSVKTNVNVTRHTFLPDEVSISHTPETRKRLARVTMKYEAGGGSVVIKEFVF